MTHTVTIPVELPSEALVCSNEAPQEVGIHLRLLWLLEQVRTGHLSTGKAAELLGLTISDFMKSMAAHGIAHPNYSVDDLRREFGLIG
jgi:predicted HTH domain antitoxin